MGPATSSTREVSDTVGLPREARGLVPAVLQRTAPTASRSSSPASCSRSWCCRSSRPSAARCSCRCRASQPGGRARPRRDPLGDDPHRGAAVRPPGHHRRDHAGPRPRARRDHRRRPGAVGRFIGRPAHPRSPRRQHHRRQHRQRLRRGQRDRPRRAHRLRPGAVRDHARRQRRRARGHLPPLASSPEARCDHRRAGRPGARSSRAPPRPLRRCARGPCPAGRRWRVAVVVLPVTAGLFAVTDLQGRAGYVVVAALLYLVARPSLYDPGRRGPPCGRRPRGHHRWSPARFLLALVPLGAWWSTGSSRAASRFDPEFFTHSLRGIGARDAGGGAYHAIIGTLEQVGIATLFTVPLGLLVADLRRRVRPGPPGLDDPLLRRRHDRHPVDRRRPVRLLVLDPRARLRLLRLRRRRWR